MIYDPRFLSIGMTKRKREVSRSDYARIIESMGGYAVYQIGPRKGRPKDIESLKSEYRRITQCERTVQRAKTRVTLRSNTRAKRGKPEKRE